jgi:non-homologous end joining protein Ku
MAPRSALRKARSAGLSGTRRTRAAHREHDRPWTSVACADRLSDAILALVNQKVKAGDTAPVAKKKPPARTPRRA